ncbi:MAG: hypothetical protein A2W31_17285 [Planctomycetes bacterium RBG_16_64_10]|nr:MAG: hypothetical protein A2W31_17285 [Planctomycetes bacterium RBG_16_64_10]
MLRRFFAGLTESTFYGRLGIGDPPLVDYLAELLARFVRSDAIFGIHGVSGKRLVNVADMLVEAEARQGEARRKVHRHIGDFTLFWTGVYPERIARLRRIGQKDSLIDYHTQGKRAYHIASTIPVASATVPAAVLERLSREFELCAYGLSEVRRQWERRDGGDSLAMLIR